MTIRTGVEITADSSGYVAGTSAAADAARELDVAQKATAAGMRQATVSAGQYQQAIRQLPAQVTDVVTSLASGMPVWMVAIQQGGQIKDSFGGAGNALRGLASIISPATIALLALGGAAGVAAFQAARAARDADELRDVVALTGNAAGLTSIRLAELSARVSSASAQTLSASREILIAIAATGRTSAELIESQGKAIARIADLSGQATEKIAASFASQLKDPAKFAAQLTEQYNFLTLAQFKRVQQLQAENKAVEAANFTNDLLVKQLEGQRRQLSTLGVALEEASKGWDRFWASVRGTVYQATTAERIAALRKDVANITKDGEPAEGTFSSGRIQAIRLQLAFLGEQAKQERALAEAASERAALNRPLIQAAAGAPAPKARPPVLGPKDFDVRDRRVQAYQENDTSFIPDEFINRVLEAQRDRDNRAAEEEAKRVEQASKLDEQRRARFEQTLTQLNDANRASNIALITDDRQRGEAQIALEEEVLQRRLLGEARTDDEIRRAKEELAKWRVGREAQLVEDLKPQWQRMVEGWADANKLMQDSYDRTVTAALQAGEQAWIKFSQTGKLSVKSLVDAMEVELARTAFRQFISLGFNALGLGFGSGGGGGAPTGGNGITLPSSPLTGGSSLDRAVAQAGGGRGGVAAAGVSITVVNATGTAAQATATQRPDGSIEVLLSAAENFIADRVSSGVGPVTTALSGRFGLRPTFSS